MKGDGGNNHNYSLGKSFMLGILACIVVFNLVRMVDEYALARGYGGNYYGGAGSGLSTSSAEDENEPLVDPALAALEKAKANGGNDDDEDADSALAKERKQHQKKEKNEKSSLLQGVEIVELKGSSGWLPGREKLVEKRPPRECPVKHIAVQVFDPLVYMSKTPQGEKWQRRAFSCMVAENNNNNNNNGGCRPAVLEDLNDRQWKSLPKGNVDATFLLTNLPMLSHIRDSQPALFKKIYYEREGTTYIDTILGSGALSGNTLEQYATREKYVRKFGCSMNDLRIQTQRYRVDIKSDCQKFLAQVKTNARKVWVQHEHTAGATNVGMKREVHSTIRMGAPEIDLVPLFKDKCVNAKREDKHIDLLENSILMSQEVDRPLLIQKKSFDVRGYMLVGSTMPFMVFFRRGYIRRSANDFTSGDKNSFSPNRFEGAQAKDRYLSLEQFQRHFANTKVTGTHFVDTFLQSAMKQIALFVFHASRKNMIRRRGSYQVFSIDYLVDDGFRVYLDKTDGYPDLLLHKAFDTGQAVAEMHDLLLELNEEPLAFEGMTAGDKYGGWELIFSELQETCDGNLYNPCHSFIDFNARSDLKKSNRRAGLVHNAANREKHEQTRVIKKVEENKKNTCKVRKLHYPGAACDKLMKSISDAKFKEKFAEHEKEFNPNLFRVAKPGEVFPWEIV